MSAIRKSPNNFDIEQTVQAVLDKSVLPAARVMSGLEDDEPWAFDVLKQLHTYAGKAHVVGLTGPPGVGKSTLIDTLVAELRKNRRTVGIVAVDPSSPCGGGAIMGDRVRMRRHANDPGVFIRSVATRGHLGGLTASTAAIVKVMDAMGFEIIVVETVGVGQVELEVAGLADTTIVVTAPGLGDDIQAIKAGILEVGEILLINKSDLPGLDAARLSLAGMLEMNRAAQSEDSWPPVLLTTCAKQGHGMDELCRTLDTHWKFLQEDDGRRLIRRRRQRIRQEVTELIVRKVMSEVLDGIEDRIGMQALVDDILNGKRDPYSASDEAIHFLLSGTRRTPCPSEGKKTSS